MKFMWFCRLLPVLSMPLAAADLRFEAENAARDSRCHEVADRRFSGGKAIAGDAAELTFHFNIPAAGRYRLIAGVRAEKELLATIRNDRDNRNSPRLGLRIDAGEWRRPVAIFTHERHQPDRQREIATPVWDAGLHSVKVKLPAGLTLDHLTLRPFAPSPIPEAARLYQPPVLPPPEHPRLLVTPQLLPELRRRLNQAENRPVWEKLLAAARQRDHYRPRTNGTGNNDRELEKAVQAKALAGLLADDATLRREAVALFLPYLRQVYFDNMTDVTRQIGHLILTGSMLFDWCHGELSAADRSDIARRLTALAELTEIGNPPFRQMVVNGHGNEMQFTRDYLAMGIAIYEENPQPYRLGTYRFLEEIVPMHRYEYQSQWHNQGVSYGIVRFSGDVIASLLYRRMAGYEAFGRALADVPYSWLYLRLPDGTMFRDGDDFYMTNQRGKYSSNYESTFLTAAYTGDPVLKGESHRQGMGDWEFRNPVLYLLLNDPAVKPQPDHRQLPLTRLLPEPYPAMLARTGWQMGEKSRDVLCFVKGAGYQSVGHQHLDAGAFQLYYRGLQAVDLGIYFHFGSPYDRNFNKRSIAHNTLLVFDPEENWGRLANDGGQQYFCGWPTGMSPASLAEMREKSRNGARLGAAAGPDRQAPDFSFLKSDLAAAYTGKIRQYVRTAIFLNLKNAAHPAALLIFDRVARANPAHQAYFLLNTLSRPKQIAPDQLLAQYGDGQLHATFLQPSGPLRFEMATGLESRRVFGKEFDVPATGLPEENGTRTMVSAPDETQPETQFLAVLQPGDRNVSPLPVKGEMRPGYAEIRLGDRLILLGSGFAAFSGRAEFAVGTDTPKVLLADFAAGAWTLRGPDGLRPLHISAGEHASQLILAPGQYQLAPAN